MENAPLDIDTRRLGPPIRDGNVGERLDEYLAAHFLFLSRSGWQREISAGNVLINGKSARKSARRLQIGDDIRRVSPIDEEPEVDTSLEVLWNDGDLAAVYKPAGLPMHESGRYRLRTVVALLPKLLGEEWAYVHRLDRETSGVLICGRTPELRKQLVDDWTHKRVQKTYLAVTRGIPSQFEWRVNMPIKFERLDRSNRAFVDQNGDEAITDFKVLYTGKQAALIAARPITGRTNQIRVHAEACDIPLMGDKKYGCPPEVYELYRKEGNTPRVQELAGFPRHALHSWKIQLPHPITRREHEFSCPLTNDLSDLCRAHGILVTAFASALTSTHHGT